MLNVVVTGVMALVVVAMLLSLYRLLVGPSLPDRVIALDTLYVNTVAIMLLLGIYLRTGVHFEAVLLIATIGFVATCTLAKFMLRGNIME